MSKNPGRRRSRLSVGALARIVVRDGRVVGRIVDQQPGAPVAHKPIGRDRAETGNDARRPLIRPTVVSAILDAIGGTADIGSTRPNSRK
jgi:hypothetical protein